MHSMTRKEFYAGVKDGDIVISVDTQDWYTFYISLSPNEIQQTIKLDMDSAHLLVEVENMIARGELEYAGGKSHFFLDGNENEILESYPQEFIHDERERMPTSRVSRHLKLGFGFYHDADEFKKPFPTKNANVYIQR